MPTAGCSGTSPRRHASQLACWSSGSGTSVVLKRVRGSAFRCSNGGPCRGRRLSLKSRCMYAPRCSMPSTRSAVAGSTCSRPTRPKSVAALSRFESTARAVRRCRPSARRRSRGRSRSRCGAPRCGGAPRRPPRRSSARAPFGERAHPALHAPHQPAALVLREGVDEAERAAGRERSLVSALHGGERDERAQRCGASRGSAGSGRRDPSRCP